MFIVHSVVIFLFLLQVKMFLDILAFTVYVLSNFLICAFVCVRASMHHFLCVCVCV